MFLRKKLHNNISETDNELVASSGLKHIAFIMDGNGRWAKSRGLPRSAGHKKGADTFKKIVRRCGDIGIKIVTVYAFSTENWKRPDDEIEALLKLLDKNITDAVNDDEENDVKYVFLGDKSVFGKETYERLTALEKLTENNSLTLNIALNYGGRAELVYAFNRLISEGRTSVTEDDISRSLYTGNSPDPDLIVRTAGEYRLSNFLLWQSAYSELYVTDTLWPDFGNDDLRKAVVEYSRRNRKYGGV